MATSTAPPVVTARTALPLSPDARRRRVEVSRWALAHGHVVTLDALTVILFGRAAGRSTSWTVADIGRFLTADAPDLCRQHQVEVPAGMSETLWSYIGFLADEGELRGATLLDLTTELTRFAGLNRAGRLRHPAGGRRPGGEVRVLRRLRQA